MAKNPIRALPWGLAAARRLYTAAPPAVPAAAVAGAAAAEEGEETVNLEPLYYMLWTLGIRGEPGGSVELTMEEWRKERKRISETGLIRIVKKLRSRKQYRIGLEVIDWMESRGMKMSANKYAIHLDLIAKVKGIEFAESYFSSLPDSGKDLPTYATMLNSYCKENMVDKAIALYAKMKELNFASLPMVHNQLMALYLRLGQPDKVQILFQEMKANNIFPDNISYNNLIRSYASLEDIVSVEKIIQEMEVAGVAYDWSTYVTLARVYNSAGLHEKAKIALKMAERYMRGRFDFHFLITLYADAGTLAEVSRVWKSLKATYKDDAPTNTSYHAMLSALSKLNEFDALKECFEEWESNCIFYDTRLANVMIGAYLRKGMIKDVETLLKKVADKGVGPESSDIRTLDLFMENFLKIHEMELPQKSFEVATSQVKRSQCKLDKEKLNEFLKYFQEVKDEAAAEIFFKILKKLNCLDGETYDHLLRTCITAVKRKPSLYGLLEEVGSKLSSKCEKLVKTVYG